MADESVIFEIQVAKKTLQQVLSENQHLKDNYDKITTNETLKNVSKLKSENDNLRKIIEELKTGSTRQNGRDLENNADDMELSRTRARLEKVENENVKLMKENLNLELQLKNMSKKLRLEEERNKCSDLAHVECKMSKLKLQSLENEKKYLLEDFEKERKILTKLRRPRVAAIEDNLRHLRSWMEKEIKERRPKDTEEVKFLKAKIQMLENDRVDLLEGFELERGVFRKILKGANKEYDLP